MMPTFSERQELAEEFASHVARMQRCLQAAGRYVSDDDIVWAWAEYSDWICATWLMLPEDDCKRLDKAVGDFRANVSDDMAYGSVGRHCAHDCRAWTRCNGRMSNDVLQEEVSGGLEGLGG